ncbi:hypothetical protein D7V86_19490 [bacterium D16-51]|nr:hypothetical protein D7V96_19710 [bacterium D16-59]RKI56552.1 hypothetical protein D7V86_19490 [bacterium D16-51]
MAKQEKRRSVDFSKKEMTELSACKSDAAFDYRMKKLAEHYGIDLSELKQDSDVRQGESFYPAECDELIALLARCYPFNPVSKQGNASDNTSGRDICDYYTVLVQEIEDLPEELRDMVHSLPSYFTAKKLTIWTERISGILMNFVLSFVEHTQEDMGALLQRLSIDMDKADYMDFFNQYMLKRVAINNRVAMEQGGVEIRELLKAMGLGIKEHEDLFTIQNASLDYEIAKLINSLLFEVSKHKNDMGFEEDDRTREEYYKDVLGLYVDKHRLELDEMTINRYVKGATDWDTVEDRIRNGDRVHEMAITTDKEIEAVKQNIEFMESQIVKMREELSQLQGLSEEEKAIRDKSCFDMIDDVNAAYIRKCEANREMQTSIYDGSDKFVGRILWEFLNIKT